jgi:hypothetical protein
MSELHPSLEESLRGLMPAAQGDWSDVASRARRLDASRSRRRRRLLLALSLVVLVLATGTALAIGNRLFGDRFTVSTAREQAPTLPAAAPYVSGQTLYRAGKKPQRLAAPLNASLLGQDATLVVASPDRSHIAYHSWRDRVPLLFVHDTVAGTDRLLARGAQTVAWGRDGRIAYFKADHARYDGRNGAYIGRVMVQTLHGTPVAWTRQSGGYLVLAWARDELLVAVRSCYFPNCSGDPEPGVYALSASGRLRPLRLAALASLSPDGRYAFGQYQRSPGQDSPSPLVRLVDVATGRILATLDLTRGARAAGMHGQLPGALTSASWRGDEIVATFTGEDSRLVFFGVRGRQLRVQQFVRVPAATLPNLYGVGFGVPMFTGKGTRRVVVLVRATTVGDREVIAVLACDRRTLRCVRGQTLPDRKWFAVVSNPSRPSGGR